MDFGPYDSASLDDQFPAVERFLANKVEVLEELAATCEIDLFLGWRPQAGQDHVVFGQTLIRLLGRIGAVVALDTYTGCECCEPDDAPAD